MVCSIYRVKFRMHNSEFFAQAFSGTKMHASEVTLDGFKALHRRSNGSHTRWGLLCMQFDRLNIGFKDNCVH
eukprot:m.931684 g.931684  ORF g.931684 m.931684 type:complete len:72 (-) comp23785_c0_seq14:2083-2298(-)